MTHWAESKRMANIQFGAPTGKAVQPAKTSKPDPVTPPATVFFTPEQEGLKVRWVALNAELERIAKELEKKLTTTEVHQKLNTFEQIRMNAHHLLMEMTRPNNLPVSK